MKAICIYHGFCDDGFAAAMVVHRHFNGKVELFAGNYGKPAPDVAGREVVIVDFSYKRADMKVLADQAKRILMLDHHKSAMEDMAGFERPNCQIVFDMNRSGAMMAWDYFNPKEEAPEFIKYIQDRDLWTKKLPFIDEFTMGLRSYPQDIKTWVELTSKDEVPRLVREGMVVMRYYRQQVEQAKSIAFETMLGGHAIPICNSTFALASDVAGELAEGRPFAAVYYETKDGFVYSLRSRKNGLDVSKIAAEFGGGGHAQAAGFKSDVQCHIEAKPQTMTPTAELKAKRESE